jgi:hypothetical protein
VQTPWRPDRKLEEEKGQRHDDNIDQRRWWRIAPNVCILWLGSLVFSNIRSPGRWAMFGVFWAVAADKMVWRLATTLAIRCSFSTTWNPEIIDAYIQQALKRSAGNHGGQTWCEFAVMGEEKNR